MADDDFSATTGGSSPTARGGMTVDQCQKMIQKSLRIPTVKFLKEHLEKSGCTIGTNFIKAIDCTNRMSGGYAPGQGIVVCSNHLQLQDEVNQVVIHELIHAYDDCRAANLNWKSCAHHACSEIRAGHLSGDCHYKRELLRGFVEIRGHEQLCDFPTRFTLSKTNRYSQWKVIVDGHETSILQVEARDIKDCVRRRVMQSVTANPYCSEAAAKDAMEAVWDVCYNDTRPFDRAP